MRDSLVVNAWVGVQNGCEITCTTEGKDGAYFTVRSADSPPFEFSFAAGALREFIAVGNQALADLDEPHPAQRVHTAQTPMPVNPCQPAEHSA